MINLLPKIYKTEIRAARTNVVLIRYSVIIFIAFAFLVLILAGSVFLLTVTKRSSDQLIAANEAKAAQYSETSAEINRLTNSLTTSRAVLDGQISYAKVLQSIASSMPSGTVMGEIKLTDASFDGTSPTSLTIYAKTNDAAVAVGKAFQTKPGFRGAKIESVSETGGISGYPISATLNVTLSRSIGQ